MFIAFNRVYDIRLGVGVRVGVADTFLVCMYQSKANPTDLPSGKG